MPNRISPRTYSALLAGLLAAAALFACYALFFRNTVPELNGDAARWNELAVSFALGEGLQPPHLPQVMDREPFYPVFMGSVYRLFGYRIANVLFAQSLALIAALAAVAWWLAPRIGTRSAVAVSALTAVVPGVASLAVGSLLPETLALVLFLLAFIAFGPSISGGGSGRNAAFAGLLLGALALTRYIFYPLPFILIAAMVVCRGRFGIERPWRLSAYLIAAFLVPVAWWTAYVYAATGSLSPIGTKGGAEVLLNASRAELSGKNLFAYAVGAAAGDVTGRRIFPAYEKEVEPYFTSSWVLETFTQQLTRDDQAARANISGIREGAASMLAHPLRYGVVAAGQFFIKNSPMLWHNGADMRHLFAGTYPNLPEWFKVASVALSRLVFIGAVLCALYIAVGALVRRGTPAYLLFPAVAVLSENVLHVFFDSVPRHALPLYLFYILFVVIGVRSVWRRSSYAHLPSHQ